MYARRTGRVYQLGLCIHGTCTRSILVIVTSSHSVMSMDNYRHRGWHQQRPTGGEAGSKFDGMSKIYADNLTRYNSDSSRGIAGCGGTSATQIVITAASSAPTRMTAPTSRQSVSRISDADSGSTSSEADINRASAESGGGSSSRGGEGKCGTHSIRPSPSATPITVPGPQTAPTATPSSPKSVLQVFLGSAARGIFLCETTPTRSPASHSR